MNTKYLKFPDEATAKTILEDYWLDSADYTGWITASHTHALDPVGVIFRQTGVILQQDEFGNWIPEFKAIEGWHVNFIGELPELAFPYIVTPENPVRVFAGLNA